MCLQRFTVFYSILQLGFKKKPLNRNSGCLGPFGDGTARGADEPAHSTEMVGFLLGFLIIGY